MEDKIKIGSVLYDSGLLERKVTKVGNKYFYVDGDERYNYSLETLEYRDKNYSQFTRKLFKDKQVLLDNKEFDKLSLEIRRVFSGYGKLSISLDKLRKIKEILDIV